MESNNTCQAILKTGKRSGQKCGCKAKYVDDNDKTIKYCGRHNGKSGKSGKSGKRKNQKSSNIIINIDPLTIVKKKYSKFGCHLSKSTCFRDAKSLGINTFQLFVKSPRGFACKIPSNEESETFRENSKGMNIVVHASYILNPCKNDVKKLNVTRGCFVKECQKVEMYGVKYVVFHPGTCPHKGDLLDEVLKRCAKTIDYVHSKTKNCILLIENMDGAGNKICYKLSHIKAIIDYVKNKLRVGICIDTCHAHAAGYALHSEEGFNDFIKEIKDLNVESYIKVIHVNDSKTPFNSHKDRHENIGKGTIGVNGIVRVMNYFHDTIMVLETPNPPEDLKLLIDPVVLT